MKKITAPMAKGMSIYKDKFRFEYGCDKLRF